MSFEDDLGTAVRSLVRRDPVIRDLKRRHGLPGFRPGNDHLNALVRSILSQQISGSAARTIIGNVLETTGSLSKPEAFATVSDDALRSCGVSPQKLSYLRSLIGSVSSGDIDLSTIHTLSNDDIARLLTSVRGIGEWTAKMFLMFSLGRLDVPAYEDLGVQNGAKIAYGLRERPTYSQIEEIAATRRWSPYQSVSCWYMWRACE